jgi:DNA polymerase I
MAHRICLVDGNALIYQAFYGNKAELYNPAGVRVNAVYTFLRTMISLLSRVEPISYSGAAICWDHPSSMQGRKKVRGRAHVPKYTGAAVCWDHPARTKRSKDFRDYKAGRAKMPDDLRPQMALSMEAVASCGVAQFQIPTVEADDLIATIATLARDHGAIVDILSPDKDMLQLVNEHVTVEHSITGKIYDEAAVVERYGVPPSLLPEMFAFIGDKVDNLPGVSGIGPKRARDLLTQYGSIESIMEACETETESNMKKSGLHLVKAHLNNVSNISLHHAASLNRMAKDVLIPEFETHSPSCGSSHGVFDILGFPPLPHTNENFMETNLFRFIQEQNFKSLMG